jgi:Redoxin
VNAEEPDRPEAEPPPKPPPTVIDTRRYRWTIGIFGLVLVIAFSIYLFATRGGGETAGVPAGKQLPKFVAPLATSDVRDDYANTSPRCDPAHPNPLGLNVCGHTPLVLGLFVTDSSTCERQVDVIQAVSREFEGRGIEFAAVAVDADRQTTAALVRSHHWTIPVAYDRDGAVGSLYGVEVCPLVELAYRGGEVAERLIGDHWLTGAALAARVRELLGANQ